MNVLVLGCGPAGLMAAHAAALAGNDIKIASMKKKSYLNGCQYLHAPIPGLSAEVSGAQPIQVSYTLKGTPTQYREKVYGKNFRGMVSPEQYADSDHFAWDLRRCYDELWEMYSDYIIDLDITGATGPHQVRPDNRIEFSVSQLLMVAKPDITLSTIPAPLLCDNPDHGFYTEQVWAMGDAPGIGQAVPIPCPEATIICDGTPDASWYRVANVFGHKTVEWPWRDGKKPPLEGVVEVLKPIKTNCDCYETAYDGRVVVPLGRYGRWQKGYLSHQAFADAYRALRSNGSMQMVLPGLEATA